MSKEISDSDKTILKGRIYPIIQGCISNRYKIIIGYFAIIGFLLSINEKLEKFIDSGAVVFLTIIFTLFVIHNSTNHWRNIKEQQRLEGEDNKFPVVDILSSFVIMILIWGGYCFISNN